MKEKIAFASWSFIKIMCAKHGEELVLKEVSGRPTYSCPNDECALQVPPAVYEKLLEDTVSKLNSNRLVIGSSWRRRYLGKTYECSILAAAAGKQPEIGIKTFE